MKVFFYVPSLASGGAERQCAIVASGLKRKYGHIVTVLLNCAGGQDRQNNELLSSADIPVVVLPSNPFSAFLKLYCLFRENKEACVFTYLARPNLCGAVAARMAGLRNVYSGIRCGWLPVRKFICELMVNRCLARGTIFNSYRAYDKFTRLGFNVNKCQVISNAIDVWNESPERPERDVVRIVTVGRYTKEKDYYTWLSVIKSIVESGCSIKAHIVGWGRMEPDVRRWIDEMALQTTVEMHAGDINVREILGECDVYLSTSLSEGVSNAILEAMDSGLPVVTTDAGDAKQMIKEGCSGYVTKIRDVAALADAVKMLILNYADRIKFGQCARQILAAKYSVGKVVDMYHELIMGLPSGRSSCDSQEY